ncbi:MAG: MBL fold metallo-hydrolase [Clostridium sp.]|nr:MBL fold metallo-hydrolase [Clostridium sp.]
MNKKFTGGLSLFLVLFFSLFLTWHGAGARKAQASPAGTLEVHMLDVRQGLCVFLRQGDHCMLYDGGGRESSSFVVAYLKQQGVGKLDYIVASHYDEDHISGLIGAMNVFGCGVVLDADYVSDTGIYESFMRTVNAAGAAEIHPAVGEEYAFGDASFSIVGPESYLIPAENDRSVAIRMTFGDNSILLCGDAQQEEEYAIAASGLALDSQIYVVNHHGGATSSTGYFLDRVHPAYAFLSCGKENTYGHPAEDVLKRLKGRSCSLFRTDKQGTVVAVCDGSGVTFSVSPTDDWTPGETGYITIGAEGGYGTAAGTRGMPAADSGITYILNTRSMKFHYPNCPSVAKMKEKNRAETDKTREEVMAQGYSPCGNCKP